MRLCSRCLPPFAPLSSLSPGVRHCHSLSSSDTASSTNAPPSSAAVTERPPFRAPCTHGPTERLLAAAPFSLHDVRGGTPNSLTEVRLAPAAAALLKQRARDSVLRQDMCAADLHYLMQAEQYAAQQQQQERRRRRPASGAADGSLARTEQEQLLRTTKRGDSDMSPAVSRSEAALRARQLADLMVGRAPDSRSPSSSRERLLDTRDRGVDESRTSVRFRQQQRLFALRRRLAYMLADDDSDGRAEDGEEGPSLRALGRRAALALSLAQDIVDTSELDEREKAEEGQVEREEGKHRPNAEGRFSQPASVATWEDESNVEAARRSGSLDHLYSVRCAFVYRSLAQPLELTGRELDALLRWCARLVVDYAAALVETIRRDAQPAQPHNDSPMSNHVGGESEAAPTPPPVARTSAVRPPSTLRMAATHRTTAAIIDTTTNEADEQHRDVGAPFPGASPAPELCDATVSATASLVELATAFVSLATTLLRSRSGGVGVGGSESAAGREPVSRLSSHVGAASGVDVETSRRGQLVADVVESVCDTLGVLCGPAGRTLLTGSVQVRRDSEEWGGTTLRKSETTSRDATAPSSPVEAPVKELLRSTSFSDHFVHSALCNMRESWAAALLLTQRMHESNVQLREVLLTPSGRAEVRDDGRGSSPDHSPRALPRSTLHTLLYILAQHGRLAEVLDLCQRHFGFTVHDLFCSAAPAVPATAGSATGAPRVAPALRLMGHIAAANADPATAARHLLTDTSPSSPASLADAAAATSLPRTTLYTQASCLEHVVRAGVMPQRVLGVTEYAMLLRRMLGTRLVHGCGSSSSSGHHHHHYRGDHPGAAGDTVKSQSAGAGCGVGWWLSPSQVWRFSAGYPHHIRATLCLMGFQVNAQRGLAAALSMEDLYVVVSVSRQRMAARVHLPSTTPTRGAEVGMAAATALHWREKRWATWGVEERPAPVLSYKLLSSGARERMPQQAAAAAHSLLPLLARRTAPPHNARCMQSLCAAFTAAHCPPHGAGSAVLLSLVSREMLQLLRAVHYTRDIGSYWEAALRCAATSVQACGGYGGTLHGGPSSHEQSDSELRTAEVVVEEIAFALAHAAESALSDSLDATRRLVAPIPSLAPYLSAYTVDALVQRPFRRALTWEQCLALLPYAPLGSRSQLWLLRRVAQDGEGRRRAFADVPSTSQPHSLSVKGSLSLRTQRPTVSPVVATFSHTAERMMAVQHNARRQQSRSVPLDTTAMAQSTLHEAVSASAGVAGADADAALLKLLLEGHWRRALRVFEQSAARVRVGGAPHVVRLLVEADVWRDLDAVQRRPLVRLAVQSSASAGAGGPTALLEEVLQTSLEHGLWHTGLYFHQSVAAEQPELVQQCRRAQLYAAQLCRGLLGRTSMTLTVAQLTKAARCGRWAEAAACFLRYATHSGASVEGREEERVDVPEKYSVRGQAFSSSPFPPKRASGPAVPATSAEELCALAAVMNARRPASEGSDDHAAATAPPTAEPPTFSFFAEGGGAVPAELSHVAQTVRYAMLHTPELWMHALRWLPTSALPLPYAHEVALRVLCAGNPAMQHALLPASASVSAQKRREEEEEGQRGKADAVVARTATSAAAVSAATATALSVVSEARRAHRPQRPNEAGKERQVTVANALQVLRHTGAWEEAILLYEKAVEANCMPYTSSNAVLESALQGGAPWEVTLYYFFHMAQRFRPDVAATAVALQACVEGDQWALAFRVLQQSVLTQSAPVPRLVELAVSAALHCGVWARALAAAQQYRRTRDPRLAHTVLLTFVRTRRWDDAVEYFYECTLRGLRPLDASLELAILASESASAEYRRTALMVGTIASALEDLYKLSGAVLEHILFVQRHSTSRASAGPLSMGVGWEGPLSFGSREVTWGEQWGSVDVSVEGDLEVRPAGHADPNLPVLAMNLPDARASPRSPRQG